MSEAKVVINYESVVQAIGEEFQDIWYALQDLDDSIEANKEIKEQIANIKCIEISDEQSFVPKRRDKKLLQGTLYVVVRFGSGAINYANSVTPISLYCVGTANKVKPAQLLLGVFVSTWTTKNLAQELVGSEGEDLEIHDALQVWNTPEIVTNFNEIDADFKNLFRVTGNIVVGPSAIRLGKMTYYFDTVEKTEDTGSISITISSSDLVEHEESGRTWYTLDKRQSINDVEEEDWASVSITSFDADDDFDELRVDFDDINGEFVIHGVRESVDNPGYVDGAITINYSYEKNTIIKYGGSETVNIMSFQDGYQASLDSQPFGNTNGFAKSEVNFSTYAFTISTYLVNGQLGKDMLAVRGFRFRPQGVYSEETSKFYANKYVKVKLEFTNGYTNMPGENEINDNGDIVKGDDFYCYYKVVSSQIGQEIAGIPSLVIAFAR